MEKRVFWILLGVLILTSCAPIGAADVPAAPTYAPQIELPEQSPGRPSQDVVMTYRRSGGIAGISEEWVLYGDGRLSKSDADEWQATPEQVAQLLAEIEALGFFELDGDYVPFDTCCDRFTFELTVRSGGRTHTVSALSAEPDTPDVVWEVLDLVGRFIEEVAE